MKKVIMSAVLAFAGLAYAGAVPALRDSILVKQPDGTTVTVYLRGDERAHMYFTTDGVPVDFDKSGALRYARLDARNMVSVEGAPLAANPANRDDAAKRYLANLPKIDFAAFYSNRLTTLSVGKAKDAAQSEDGYFKVGKFPTTGKIKGLVLLVEFSNKKFHYDHDFHNQMMNEPGFNLDGGTGSARDYFIDQSYQQFQPDFTVVGPITLSNTMEYYGANNTAAGDDNMPVLIAEACNAAKSAYGVNFADYDYDNDGAVDMIYIIYAGYGEHAGGGANTIWPHTGNYEDYGKKLSIDGKSINKYACSSELYGNEGTQSSSIGVFCHEFSHVLGLADHYSTRSFAERPYFLGYYDVMDYGNYNNESRTPAAYTAFERYTLGWIKPEEMDSPQDGVTLKPLADSKQAFKLDTPNTDEFFMLENRQKKGWDAYLPSSGMMITYIDFDRTMWEDNIVNTASRPRYTIKPADNTMSFNDSQNDLYPSAGRNSFTDETSPSSLTYNGRKTDKWVTNITRDGENIKFDFMANHLHTPVVLPPTNMAEGSFTANWETVPNATKYKVNLYKVTSESQAEVAIEEDFAAFTYGSVDYPSRTNIASQLDEYTKVPGWTGEKVYSAGGWVKIGSSGVNGSLTTPSLNLAAHSGKFTVAVTARPEAGIDNATLGAASGSESGTTTLAQDATTYVFVFTSGTASSNVTISTSKSLALLDDVKVMRGDVSANYPDAVVVPVNGEAAKASTTKAEDGGEQVDVLVRTDEVTTNSISYTGLEKSLYRYSVIALDATRSSFESAKADADLTFTGIAGINNQGATALDIECRGRLVTVSGIADGANVEIYSADGRQVASFAAPGCATLPQGGLYIVKANGKTSKLVVD